MKTDPRNRYTRQVIAEAFLQLLQHKGVAKITVKEVCEIAQINRGTFYRHYKDCYDLFEQLQDKALTELEEILTRTRTQGVQPVLTSLLQTIQDDRWLIGLLVRKSGDNAFLDRAVGRCFRYMETVLAPAEDRAGAMRNVFLIAGASGVMQYWVCSGMTEPATQVAAAITALCTSATSAKIPG